MKKIVLTGGGSAGHVMGNIAILPKLKEDGWDVEYIGSEEGIERQIIEDINLPYHPISVGKLRRYFDLKNFKDPFKVITGVAQSYLLLRKIKPQIVFSKGGFVSVPVIIASKLLQIPVIIHESDLTPGLANKIAIPFASKVCVTFPETLKHISSDKAVHTGSPIREEILQGDADRGYEFCGFDTSKPVLLIIGGSLGSEKINLAVRACLDLLLPRFQIVHICGKGHIDHSLEDTKGYKQFEYISSELPDVFAMADIMVSRAGANSLFEFLALKKPNVLIPLSRLASRGDQIVNAQSFQKLGYSKVLYEEDLSKESLFENVSETYDQRQEYIAKMSASQLRNSVSKIVDLIENAARK